MEGGLLEGADYLHDKAFIEESVMTDWDDPSDGGSFFKDEVQVRSTASTTRRMDTHYHCWT